MKDNSVYFYSNRMMVVMQKLVMIFVLLLCGEYLFISCHHFLISLGNHITKVTASN